MLDGTPQNKLDMFMASNSSPLTSLFNEAANEMAIESENSSGFVPYHHLPMILPENGPKRRAETWVFEEIQCLIHLRRELNCQFNTAKSQKHLWDQIYVGMRENGWERTPQNCNDKWRNLLKEYKKSNGGIGSSRQVCFDELEEYCREKKSNGISKKLRDGSSVQILDKGTDEAGFLFGPSEGLPSCQPLLCGKKRSNHLKMVHINMGASVLYDGGKGINVAGTSDRMA